MKIGILGGGAMGSVFAAFFHEAGFRTVIIRRSEEAVRQIRRNGLRITGYSGDRTLRPEITHDPTEAGVCDLVVLAVKAWSLESALIGLQHLLHKQTTVITIQNGLGSPDIVASHIGAERVIIGVAENFGAAMISPAHVHHNNMRLIRLGPFQGALNDRHYQTEACWRKAGFNVKLFQDVGRLIWEKLVCNTAFSGVSALTGLTIGQIMDSSNAWELSLLAAAETHRVGLARKIRFSFDDPRDWVRQFGADMPNARPSMLQDVDQQRRTEVDAIHGAVVREGNRLVVPTPVNHMLWSLIKAREALIAS